MRTEKFRVIIKDVAKLSKLEELNKILRSVSGSMEPYEVYQFMMCYYIMDYKLLIHRMNKRMFKEAKDEKNRL